MAKKRHLIQSSIKSFFEKHTDPEKHENLKATRKEMEKKKNELLSIVQNEGDRDGSKRGSLTKLIEDFHNQYESLYAHYDHLTGELKNKVHKHRHEKGNSSSSSVSESDSDSDDPSNEKVSEKGKLEDEILKATDGLQQELVESKHEVTLLKNKLEVVCNEKDTLEVAYDAIIRKLESTERTVEDLKVETDTLSSEKSNLLAEKEDIEEQFESKVIEVGKMAKEVSELRAHISQMEILLGEREDRISSLQTRMEVIENESNSQIEALKAQVNDFTQQVDELQAEKSQLKADIKDLQDIIGVLEQKMNTLQVQNGEIKLELEKKAHDIAEYVIQIEGLHEKLSCNDLQECKADLEAAKNQIDELTEELTIISKSKEESVAELERTMEDVKRAAFEKTRTIEVQLRLANQKLRVTEQLLNEKDEDLKISEKRFHEECKVLEDKISGLSVILAANNAVHRGMIVSISEDVNNSLSGMETITQKFREDNEKFSSKIDCMLEEIQILKHCLAGKNTNRELIEEQLRNLTEQLQNEREHGLLVKQNLSKLEVEAEKDKGEKEKLSAAVTELKKTTEELNIALKKKNEQVTILEDEKREAIRQLCLWSDNIQCRYNELKNMVAKPSLQRRY